MKNKAKIITFFNNKGGEGKTTITMNVADAISRIDKNARILIIDFDPQATISRLLGVDTGTPVRNNKSLGELLDRVSKGKANLDFTEISDCIYKPTFTLKKRIRVGNRFSYEIVKMSYAFDLLPSSIELSALEDLLKRGKLENPIDIDKTLKEIIETITNNVEYDYILIDAMSSLGSLSMGAILSSDYVVIPATLDYDAVRRLYYDISLIEFASELKRNSIHILGIVINKFTGDETNAELFKFYIQEKFSGLPIFETKINKSNLFEKVKIENRPMVSINTDIYNSFISLSNEIISKIKIFEQSNSS